MEELMTTREAAKLLGVGTTTIKRWADEGRLHCVKTAGGHRRYPRSAVEGMTEPEPPVPGTGPVYARLPQMSRAQIDALAMGVIQLDDSGRILLYNAWEARFAGYSPAEVEGRHLFGDVAPCTHNSLLWGRFKRGVESGELNVRIDYTFTYRMRPTNVRIRLYRDPETATNWMIVRPTTGEFALA